jgi:group I intron endonuclease
MEQSEETPVGCIYMIENIVNGKKYIGQTIKWRHRKTCHLSLLRRNSHNNKYLQSSWNKHGESCFNFTVLVDSLPQKYLDDTERGLIATLRTTNSEHGYNLESGGNTNKTVSEKTKRKQSEAKLKMSPETKEKMRQSQLGKKHSPERIEKARQASLGRKKSPESIEKTRQAHLGSKRSLETREKLRQISLKMSSETKEKMRQSQLGKKLPIETKSKMSLAHSGKKNSHEHNEKIRQANIGKKLSSEHIEKMMRVGLGKRGTLVIGPDGFIYPSIRSAAKCLKLNHRALNSALNRNRPYKGMMFKFLI